MTQTQKDFIALSHGKEWVSFYESFDKLVQDNLSRSSDLLRRAMSLPEVADREVQQIRTEMEAKLLTERNNQRDLLESLKDELGGSQHLVSTLARSLGAVIGNLEGLSQRVETAMLAIGDDPNSGAAVPKGAEVQSAAPVSNGAVAAALSVPEAPVIPTLLSAPVAVPAPDFTFQASAEEAVPFDISELNESMQEQQELLAVAEEKLDVLEDSIDLSAMAEAEVAAADPGEPLQFGQESVGAADGGLSGEPRARPHWLSVTRAGSRT